MSPDNTWICIWTSVWSWCCCYILLSIFLIFYGSLICFGHKSQVYLLYFLGVANILNEKERCRMEYFSVHEY